MDSFGPHHFENPRHDGYINGRSHYFGPHWTLLDHILDHFGPYWTSFEQLVGQNIFKTLPIKNISQQDRFTTSNRYITIPHHDTTPRYHTTIPHHDTTSRYHTTIPHQRTTLADFIFPPPQLRKITYLFVSTSFQVFLFRCSEFYFSP